MQLGGLSGHPELLARLDVDGLEVAHRHMVLVVRVVDAAAGFQRQHGAHYSHQGGDNQAAHGITVFVVAHCLPLYEIQYCPGRRSEEHTSELQSRPHLVCRLLLEKKKKNKYKVILSYVNSSLH